MSEYSLPPLAALFLVVFDQKIGYKLAWHRADDGVDVYGVEYKSLPSGLHEQSSDTVYFKHNGLAGLGAFARAESDAAHRNAQFAVVGALVKLDHKDNLPWQHAGVLGELAVAVSRNLDDYSVLEKHWAGAGRTSRMAEQEDHSSRSLKLTLDNLGPLLFPLQRQVLLGRRILLAGHPPVLENCRLVHALAKLASHTPTSSTALYSVGITDMSILSDSTSWVACTTDAILQDKSNIYDILVELHQDDRPRATCAGAELRATQRDVRRYMALQRQLQQPNFRETYTDDTTDERPLLAPARDEAEPVDPGTIESYTWTSVAIRSLSWLQNPDDMNAMAQEESEIEDDLLRGIASAAGDAPAAQQGAMIREYFMRSSRLLLEKIKHLAEEAEHNDILVPPIALSQAGLDAWSEADRVYFQSLLRKLTGKQAKVVDDPVILCGLRVC